MKKKNNQPNVGYCKSCRIYMKLKLGTQEIHNISCPVCSSKMELKYKKPYFFLGLSKALVWSENISKATVFICIFCKVFKRVTFKLGGGIYVRQSIYPCPKCGRVMIPPENIPKHYWYKI